MAIEPQLENRFGRAALAYATKLGWPVFPLREKEKDPLTPNGFKDATTDLAQIREWWKKNPRGNIGIPTGVAFWVLDIDPRNGGDESLGALVVKYGALPNTIQQQTGGGGRHYLFALEDPPVPNRTGFVDGVDVKSKGGYIVVPPSIHPSGNPYFWDSDKSITEEVIAPVNRPLLDAIRGFAHKAASEPLKVPKRIPKGKQHDVLFKLGCSMRAKGFDEPEIFAALWEANQNRCQEPGPRENIEKLANSICAQFSAGESQQRQQAERQRPEPPRILSCADVLSVVTPAEEMLFEEGYPLPARGLTLLVGTPKSGKTLLAVQEALAVARNHALFECYRVLKSGPVMIIEQDDPGGAASIKTILERSGVNSDTPLFVVPQLPFGLGLNLLDWLKEQITKLSLVFVVIDSYTAVRGPRAQGIDIVKQEQTELRQIDALGKELGSAIKLIHHASKGAALLDWTQTAAGSFAVTGASETQVHLSRFRDLDGGAAERLVRIQGRHSGDAYVVLRFRKDTLDFEWVLEGGAAEFYPVLKQIKAELSGTFGPKELSQATGVSRATAHRIIARLRFAGVLDKVGFGQYRLSAGLKL
jgi:hypothetical protein